MRLMTNQKTEIVTALIDGDIIPYEFGACKGEDGKPLEWSFVQSRVDSRLHKIMEATGATERKIYLTDSPTNYRLLVASIRPYKGTRPSEKPPLWEAIREFLIEHRGAEVISYMEADDKLAISQYERMEEGDTIICTVDKDLDTVPGWHYNWRKGDPYFIEELEAHKFLYKQLLTGDTVDNIPGLYGVGEKSKVLRTIDSCTTEQKMFEVCREEYEKRFGSYWTQFMTENYRLLRMLRSQNEADGAKEAVLRHREMEECMEKGENPLKLLGLDGSPLDKAPPKLEIVNNSPTLKE